jgi:hypothetical protein
VASNPVTKATAEEYLALDRAAEFRSEFLDGEIVAMSGGSMRHTRLASNLFGQLYVALQGSVCEPFNPDFRVRVSSRMYSYPDATVVCGKPLLADDRQDILLNPTAIFERPRLEISGIPVYRVATRLHTSRSRPNPDRAVHARRSEYLDTTGLPKS